jgi:hypothetical protein
LDLNLKKLVKCYTWDTSENRSEISGKFWNVWLEKDADQLDRSCEKWNVTHVKVDRNIIHMTARRVMISLFLCRNCLPRHITKGKIEGRIGVTGTRGRCTRLRDDLQETRRYWKLKEETLNHILCTVCFGRGYGPAVRHYVMITMTLKSHLISFCSNLMK